MPPRPSIRTFTICALIAWSQLGASGVARADAPALRCEAVRVGQRVLVRVGLDGFVDRDLARLVRLGLRGTVRVDATLLRSRRFWFDDAIVSRSKSFSLTYQRQLGFVLDGRRRIPEPGRIDLGTLSLGFGRVTGSGLYLELEVELQVVTVTSLRRTAGWITGQRGSRSGLVKDRVIDLVVTDLTRTGETSCRVVDRPADRPAGRPAGRPASPSR